MDTYSTYQAKSRFSEIIRKVRGGRRVIVTHHGTQVAEIRPVDTPADSSEAKLDQLEREGIIERPAESALRSRPVMRRRGALTRFLGSRE